MLLWQTIFSESGPHLYVKYKETETKELSNWTKVTQMVSGGVGTWIQDICLHKTSYLTTFARSIRLNLFFFPPLIYAC